MPKEVSNYMLRLVVEGGEFFGVSREEQRSLLSDPTVLENRWLRVDWEDLRVLLLRMIQEIGGTGWELVEAGWRYRRECFLERVDHLFWLSASVEKGFWATKHLIIPRNLRGGDLHYEKLGKDHYQIVRANRCGRELLQQAKEDSVDLREALPAMRSIRIGERHYEHRRPGA